MKIIKTSNTDFYEWLKGENVIIPFYHGTSDISFELIQKSASMKPPSLMDQDKISFFKNRSPDTDLDKVYLCFDLYQAQYYAKRDCYSWNSRKKEHFGIDDSRDPKPIVIQVSAPLHEINEIKSAIYKDISYQTGRPDEHYEESVNTKEDMQEILSQELTNEQKLQSILEYLENLEANSSDKPFFVDNLGQKNNPEFSIGGEISVSDNIKPLDISELASISQRQSTSIPYELQKVYKEKLMDSTYSLSENDKDWIHNKIVTDPHNLPDWAWDFVLDNINDPNFQIPQSWIESIRTYEIENGWFPEWTEGTRLENMASKKVKLIKVSKSKSFKLIKLCAPSWMDKEYPKKAKEKKLQKFYNFLKSKNIVIEFYHGTSDISWELIQRDGIMSPPTWRGKDKYEGRTKGLDKLFFTKDITTAINYANREAKSWDNDPRFQKYKREKGIDLDRKSEPIVVKKNVPLHYLDEIKGVIFGTWVYNETEFAEDIKNIILSESSDDEKLNEILSLIDNSAAVFSEFTIKGSVPISREEGFQHVKKIDILELWIKKLETSKIYYSSVPEELKNHPDILVALKKGWIKELENDPYYFSGPFSNNELKLKDDPDILVALKKGWIKKLENSPYCYSSPSEWSRSLAFYDDYFGVDLKNDVDILDALKNGWIKILKQDVYSYKWIKRLDLKNDPDILDALKKEWIKKLEKSADIRYEYVPDVLKSDPDILKYAPKEEVPKEVTSNRSYKLIR
jgi:hypothetical protein